MIKYLIGLSVCIALGCQTQTGDDTSANQEAHIDEAVMFPEVNDAFDGYLRNFERSALPITIKACNADLAGLTEFNGDAFSKYVGDDFFSYRQIPANGNFVATITLGAADCFLPVLTTYKLTGDKIDQKTIAIGYCGSDCGYMCEEFMTIKGNYSIYVSDTISSSQCDSLGNIIAGTTEHYVVYKKGQLKRNGAIELSEEIKIILEK